jgi:hypothetical protein
LEVQIHHLLTSSLDREEWPFSGLGRFNIREKNTDVTFIADWVEPRGFFDVLKKI